MAIRFERREKVTRYLDPRAGFQESRIPSEIRRDPLTGRTGRIAHMVGFQVAPVDLSAMIEGSRSICPFCPDRVLEVTPKFPADLVPEGRVQRGEAVVFPNLSPYDEHSAVAVMSREHYVPMDSFSPQLLADAFGTCQAYFDQVSQRSSVRYALAMWNYLPASGGTQIHPHLQLFATDTPGNAVEEELSASQRYAEREGHSYWDDLVREEERLGERFVARGQHSMWLTSFVSQSMLADTLVVFPGQRTLLDLSSSALDEFCRGLAQALRHLASQGVYSFNLAWFPGAAGRDDVWLHVRLSPRLYLMPRLWGTDTSALQHLYDEHFMAQTPEAAAQSLRGAIAL